MSEPRRQKGRLGCFGCLSIPVLALVTLIELGLVWWMNPQWFDRLAVWRGPRYEESVAIVADPALREELLRQAAAENPRPTPPAAEPVTIKRFAPAATTARYEPSRGAELSSPNGAALSVPPGAIDRATDVSLTPIFRLPPEMDAPFLGPIYDLRVGDNAHFDFQRPVRLTLPVLPHDDEEPPVVATWDGRKWSPVPSTYDPTERTVSATIQHTSDWGPVVGKVLGVSGRGLLKTAGVGVPLALWLFSTGTARAQLTATKWLGCEEYETPRGNFKLHYVTEGEDAVPSDAEYLTGQGSAKQLLRTPEEAPEYIVSLGRLLEETRAGLDGDELSIPPADAIRYDVFVCDLQTAEGESPLSGPLSISSKLVSRAQGHGVPFEDLMRATVAHELTHLAQGSFFGVWRASAEHRNFLWLKSNNLLAPQRWWCEATATYTAHWYWRRQGQPTDRTFAIFMRGNGDLLTTPMDEAQEPQWYAYAIFPRWLDSQQVEGGYDFVDAVNKSRDVSLASLDKAARHRFTESLPDLFQRFAHEFYHDDVWSGEAFPVLHTGRTARAQASSQSQAPPEFSNVTLGQGYQTVTNDWAQYGISSLKHLSAHALYMDVGPLPRLQPARLVVRVELLGAITDDLQIHLAEDLIHGSMLPLSHEAGTLSRLYFRDGKVALTILDEVGQTGEPNRATLVAVNRSLERSTPGFVVQRWLLMPPPFVDATRGGPELPRRWTVMWDHVGLKDYAPVFSRYSVYTRRVDEPPSKWRHVEDFESNYGFFDAPDDDDYVFTVSVIDRYDNESYPTPVLEQDPFAGEWSVGVVREKNGLYIKTAMDEVEAFAKAEVEKERGRVAALPETTDPERAAKRQAQEDQRLGEDLADLVVDAGRTFAPLLHAFIRVGVPMQLEIKRQKREYFLSVTTICGQPVTDPRFQDISFERVGLRSIRMKREGREGWPDITLNSPRDGIIRRDVGLVHKAKSEHTDKEYEFEFSWWFKRESDWLK